MLQAPESPASNLSQTYQVSFPIQPVLTNCPVPDCPAHPSTRNGLRRHFCTMHPNDVIVIVQEGEYPRCPYCRMFTRSVGPKHFVTKTCFQGRLVLIVFYVDGVPIETVTEFKYLG